MNKFESDWISLRQNQSGVRVFLSESERRKQGVWIQHGSVWIQHGRIQDGCHHQVESEWMSEGFFCVQKVGTNLGKCEWFWEEKLRWQNSRWLPSSSWVRMKEFESDWISLSQSLVQNGWIQDGRIQDGRILDGYHHQVEWEWMSLS